MKRTMATLCALAVLSGGLVAWQSSPRSPSASKAPVAQAKPATKAKASRRKKSAPKPVVAQPLPAQQMPPVPATLMNSAPVKPSVTLEGGMLTIDAPNSTLIDVLNGVHKATGATIEGATPTERVVVKLGPGAPGQVLAALLRGTPYDYVILGAPGRTDALTRVMLTPQTSQLPSGSAPAPETAESTGGGGGGGRAPRMLSPRQPTGDANQVDDSAGPPETEEEQPQPAAQPAQQQPPAQTQQPPADANQPKTPEQLFKELQQLNQPKPAPQPAPAPQ